jgi:hypothetical protein
LKTNPPDDRPSVTKEQPRLKSCCNRFEENNTYEGN